MALKEVIRAYAELRDFGSWVGVSLDDDAFNLSFEVAEDLMEYLWRAGCRPRGVEAEMSALKTLIFGWKRSK